MIFYDGRCHKLDLILFEIPDNVMKPWKFISSDGRFDMDFVPIYDNIHSFNAGIISQTGHQVFGKFCGTAILDDGTKLEIRNLLGFAEKVRNRY